jgi:phosphoglycolate phosphatase
MVNATDRKVDGLIFDKDGTLFDFHATWSAASAVLIEDLAQGDAALRERLAEVMHFDLEASRFHPTSPIIAGTNREAAEHVALAMPGRDVDDLERQLEDFAADAPLVAPVPLVPLMREFHTLGLTLGVMTNDSERGARANLSNAGVHDDFALIIGFDSGHGAKPDPDPLLAFSSHTGIAPSRCAMVGDSTHDLIAGRAAGMQTIAVTTGVAGASDLQGYADVVLDHIGQIPAWLAA